MALDEIKECPGGHCSTISDRVNKTCIAQGHSGDRVYVLRADGSECYCNCSCFAWNTPIATTDGTWKRIQEFQVGDSVLTAQTDKSWKPTEVAFSDGTSGDGTSVPGMIYIKTATGIELLVTSDHPFLLEDGRLQRAVKLTLNDKLIDEGFNPVGIVEINPGVWTGGIWNISTTTSNQPGEPLQDHLINTAGIITGDYYAQLFLVEEAMLSKASMGTIEYGDLPNGEGHSAELSSTGIQMSKFLPYKRFVAPKGAAPFLPEWSAVAKPGMLRPLDDAVTLETAEYVAWLFKRVYPTVEYRVREYWADNTVNAYAWQEGDKRIVALLGGLIRHVAVEKEGVALVLAHELGHHFGGAPTYPGGLSCEGQADYWGAWIAMREVFPGREYYAWMRPAIDQIFNLFSNGLADHKEKLHEESFHKSLGCAHPPADCRRDTYLAAMRLDPKPACAGLIDSDDRSCCG